MMTVEEIRQLSDEELKRVSGGKRKNGNASWEAEVAYGERRRRSGVVQYASVPTRCSKYQADIDYYGFSEV